MRTSVCALLPPRMKALVWPPSPPRVATLTPGTVCKTCAMVALCNCSSRARPTISIAWPVSDRGCSKPLAVTTMSSSAACAKTGVGSTASAAAANLKMVMILSPSHDVQTNVVTRRKTPIAPVSRKHKGQTAIRQVSWLPGQCLSPAFPVSRFPVSPVAFGAKARRLQLREQRRIFIGFPIIHALAQTWCVSMG